MPLQRFYSTIAANARNAGFFRRTPLIAGLRDNRSSLEDFTLFLKLENLQPSGSFKDRGIGNMIHNLLERGSVGRLVSSSGGNAGHAVATVGQKIGLPVDVFVPVTTLPLMIDKLKKRGANVIISGENWNAADKAARASVAVDPSCRYIPPFDDPLIWEGNSSIVDEIHEDFGQDAPPDAIILSVGGGGLLAGVQRGLDRVGWGDVPIIAVETEGAASFAAAKNAGKIVRLEKISTIATSLGALAVTSAVIDQASAAARNTISVIVSDEEAVSACLQLVDEHRLLVEPACGAALAAVYTDRHIKSILGSVPTRGFVRKIVVIVCGGSAVNLDLLRSWSDSK